MELKTGASQDPKKRLITIVAASVCILIGLSFAVYSLLPGDPVGTKFPGDPIAGVPVDSAPAKPRAAAGATPAAAPAAFEPVTKPSRTGFEPLGK